MLSNITWGAYFTFVAIALLLYYTTIVMIFYRGEMGSILRSTKLLPPGQGNGDAPASRPEYEGLEPVVADLKSILEKAGKGAEKGAVLPLLLSRLASYGGLKHPAFRIAIINYLVRNAAAICDISFSEQELESSLRRLSQ